MKSILKKTIVIILLIVLALSLGLVAVGCNDTPPTEDTFFEEGKVTYSGYYKIKQQTPIYSFPDSMVLDEYFDDTAEKDIFLAIKNYSNYIDQPITGLTISLRLGLKGAQNLKDIDDIGEKEITYFGGRTGVAKGEILVHKWFYYELMKQIHGANVTFFNVENIFEDEDTLPKFMFMFVANSSLLSEAFPLIMDKYGIEEYKITYQEGDKRVRDYESIKITLANDNGEKEVTIAGFYTTGEEDYFLNTKFEKEDFSLPDYSKATTEDEIISAYALQKENKLEKQLLAKYKALIADIYYC